MFPSGCWSTLITLLIRFEPANLGRAVPVDRWRDSVSWQRPVPACLRSANSCPEPETPVTQVNVPSGKRKSTSRKLCCRAPKSSIQPPPGGSLAPPASIRRVLGIGISLRPERYCPVSEADGPREFFRRSCGGNRSAEPPGPRTEVEEPVGGREDFAVVLDENDCISQIAQSSERFQAAGCCRGDAGRSSARRGRTSTPVKARPICPASRIRCVSPPERVGSGRARVRYSSPTSTRKASRLVASFSRSPAILRSVAESLIPFKSASDSLNGNDES